MAVRGIYNLYVDISVSINVCDIGQLSVDSKSKITGLHMCYML